MSNKDQLDINQRDKKVLIVEDSRIFSHVLNKAVQEELGREAVLCASYAETVERLKQSGNAFFAALLDLNLPDAPGGEIVDLVVEHRIPSIVFTGEFSDALRTRMWSKKIVDYVLKENRENVRQVMETLRRLHKNMGMKILVADDSATSRRIIKDLLEVWNFKVLEARDGQEALVLLKHESDISMMLVDYNMPKLDGIQVVREARKNFSKTGLPVIGLSGVSQDTTSAHFLKAGANDYMHKPFLAEELYCRVRHNIETAEYIHTIRKMAEQDFLTGLLNRRAFFQQAENFFDRVKAEKASLAVAMVDIDHFKRCNDEYGHDAGDEVIKAVGDLLVSGLKKDDLVARFGGEEYCVACINPDMTRLEWRFNKIRQSVEEKTIFYDSHAIRVSISTGVCAVFRPSLDEMITCADNQLYRAKSMGRNQVRMLLSE